jgi:hypothetical protein
MLHDVEVIGTYYIDDDSGEEYIICRIPSITFLTVNSNSGLPSNKEFTIEVSLNGVSYSDEGNKFKYINNNQEITVDVSSGPDSGGTSIEIIIDDFTPVNGSAQAATCIFPGYADLADEDGNDAGMVDGATTGDNGIRCVSPPLRITDEAIESGLMHDSLIINTVEVEVRLLNVAQNMFFTFTYLKGVEVESIDLPNMYYARDEDGVPL